MIVKVLGKSVGYKVLSQRMSQVWQLKGRFEMVNLEDGFFMVRFTEK